MDWLKKHAPQPWRSTVAPHIPAILIQRAKERRTITYGDLAAELERRHGLKQQERKTKYGVAIGAVAFALEDLGKDWGELIPPLNTLVVTESTGLPGVGGDLFAQHFLKRGLRRQLSEDDREVLLREAQEHVWNYPHSKWDRVAEALGVSAPKPRSGATGEVEAIELPPVPAHRAPESDEHKALKHWICRNPKALSSFGEFPEGETEVVIASGDRLDAYFETKRARLAVEVKSSRAPDAELTRGAFQVVKYREVLRAVQRTQGEVPNAQAVLVTTRNIDARTRKICKRLAVDYVVVPKGAECK